jgi:hypothetical protein
MRRLTVLVVACTCLFLNPLWAQCGGEERWAVKMGADPGAAQIDLQNPVPTTLHDLVRLSRPTLPSDDETRMAAERTVRMSRAAWSSSSKKRVRRATRTSTW